MRRTSRRRTHRVPKAKISRVSSFIRADLPVTTPPISFISKPADYWPRCCPAVPAAVCLFGCPTAGCAGLKRNRSGHTAAIWHSASAPFLSSKLLTNIKHSIEQIHKNRKKKRLNVLQNPSLQRAIPVTQQLFS